MSFYVIGVKKENKYKIIKIGLRGLATLLEGAGYLLSQSKISKISKFILWCLKCRELASNLMGSWAAAVKVF